MQPGGGLDWRDIFDAAAAGDHLAEKIVDETAYYLGVGAMNMMHTIDPDMIAYAGGMIAAGDGFLNRIRKHVKELAFPVPAEKTTICYAQWERRRIYRRRLHACAAFPEKKRKNLTSSTSLLPRTPGNRVKALLDEPRIRENRENDATVAVG